LNSVTENLISIEDVRVEYTSGRSMFGSGQTVRAVDGVSLKIKRGETLGLVGESGCGKSTLGRAVLRLTEPTGGRVMHNGDDLASLQPEEMRRRRRQLQMIFQDPYSSLNPRMTAGQIIGEPLQTFDLTSSKDRVPTLMETVGLDRRFIDRRPREFSGGQRQRIGIARALAADPEFIVADEPISALDVSIQAQILNLMRRLQKENGLTYLFISHDLRAIRHIADRVAVMYLGRVVELADAKDIYRDPLWSSTPPLMCSFPAPDPVVDRKCERLILRGDVPSPLAPLSGCHFHTRCPFAIDDCSRTEPKLVELKPGHTAACIRISREHPHIEQNVANGLGSMTQ